MNDDGSITRLADDDIEGMIAVSRSNRRIAYDEVEVGGKKRLVSTVFLGLDHGFMSPVPIVFETMAFTGEVGIEDHCRRYATKAEALAGHAEVLALVKAGEIHEAE